eukprot:g1268.t1
METAKWFANVTMPDRSFFLQKLKRITGAVSDVALEWLDRTIATVHDMQVAPDNFIGAQCSVTESSDDACRPRLTYPYEAWLMRRRIVEASFLAFAIVGSAITEYAKMTKPTLLRIVGFSIITSSMFLLMAQMRRINKDEAFISYTYGIAAIICAYSALSFLLYPQEESKITEKIMSVLPRWVRDARKLMEKYRLLYFFGMEVVEVLMQGIGLMLEARTASAVQVLVRGECIAFNIIVLPTMVWVSTRYPALLPYVFAMEILLDKAYMALALQNSERSFMAHVNLLVPALMSISTVQGFDSMKATARKLTRTGAFAASMSAIGIAFGVYLALTYTSQAAQCVEEIGDFAMCAEPRQYFSNGLFGNTSCGFEHVKYFSCSDVTTIRESHRYSEMTELTHIDISHTTLVTTIPSSWGMIENLRSLQMQDSKILNIPWDVATLPHLTKLDVTGAPCAASLTWSGAIDSRSIKQRIRAEIGKRLASLDISRNGLVSVPVWVEEFVRLKRIDFSWNNMTRFEASTFLGRREHFLLHGNPVMEAYLVDTGLTRTGKTRRTVQLALLHAIEGNLRTLVIDDWLKTIQEFPNLQELNVTWKEREERIFPMHVSTLADLTSLTFSNADFNTTIESITGVLTRLEEGEFDIGISVLTQLTLLDLRGNEYLNGTIPRDISKLSNLNIFRIGQTQIHGTIPRAISKLSMLEVFSIQLGGIGARKHANQLYSTSRTIFTERIKNSGARRYADTRNNSSRNIWTSKLARVGLVANAYQWEHSKAHINAYKFEDVGPF